MNSVTSPQQQQSFSTYGEISRTLQAYIDIAFSGRGHDSRDAWLDHARVVGRLDGKPFNLEPDAFCRLVSEIGPCPSTEARIVAIDFVGRAACARVEFLNWDGHRFTDFFVLHREDGGWKISGKVFDAHEKR